MSGGLPAFRNEPVLELRRAPVRAGLADALSQLDRRLPLDVAPRIAGASSAEGNRRTLVSTDPGNPGRAVATGPTATPGDVDAAVRAAAQAGREWAAMDAGLRAGVLVGAASWMRERRLELAALALRECAKPWPEADADVCEAIDFLEYYARAAIALGQPRDLLQVPGEHNELRYVARGVCAVISPWNFPLAIACGMTAAALATGNTVVLKPAEQAPGCAGALVRALTAAGLPPGALSFLPLSFLMPS